MSDYLDDAISKLKSRLNEQCACPLDVAKEICISCKAHVIAIRIIRIINEGL
jgi:hypothetical protein